MPLRLILADDHPTFRAGLREHLEREDDLTVVAEAGSGEEALAAVAEHAPDVLVLDMEMPGTTGLDVVERLAAEGSETAIVVLSAFEDTNYIFGVLDAGAAGYLSKQEPLNAIADAVRGAGRGDVGWLSRRISDLYVRQRRVEIGRRKRLSQAQASLDNLSEREREVALLVAEGLSNPDIADRLFVSESTIKKHVHTIYEKLGIKTRPQVVAWAWRSGVLPLDEDEGNGMGPTTRP